MTGSSIYIYSEKFSTSNLPFYEMDIGAKMQYMWCLAVNLLKTVIKQYHFMAFL